MSEAIKTFDYLRSLPAVEEDIIDAVRRVLHSGSLILGPETEAFEQEFADFVGARHCIGVSSGTTAIHLSLMVLGIGPGDEVITVSNTCAPTVAAIRLTGASPVFVDVGEDDLMMNIDLVSEAITPRTKCILPVHLWGQSVNMESLQEISALTGTPVVEDCSQAHGTLFRKQHVGTFGDMGCFSFYPTKNLGGYGDAGAVVTNSTDLATRLRRIRMYGYDNGVAIEDGMNARVSEIQAAILRIKLGRLDNVLRRRRRIAKIYDESIVSNSVAVPYKHAEREHSYHQYVIRCEDREAIIGHLQENNVEFGIHYPVPVHVMPAYRPFVLSGQTMPVTETAASQILSLPNHECLTDKEAQKVTNAVMSAR